MPKKPPKYSLHKPSGRARVRIDGKDVYLGDYGSDDSHRKYARVIAEWHASHGIAQADHLTLDQLAILYTDFADFHYRKNGKPTSEASLVRLALRHLLHLYGPTKAIDFGPKKLKAVRERMIDADYCRVSINRHVGRINRMFQWAVAEELIPVTIYQSLLTVRGLQANRTEAKESDPVKPVSIRHVVAVRRYVSRQVWAMIRLQLRTAARPGEIRNMRQCEITMDDNIWEYRYQSHKTAHHDKERTIYLGPKAQQILEPFLDKQPDEYLFSPTDAKIEFNELRRKNRKTPLTPSQRRRAPKQKPKKSPGDKYTKYSYGNAIAKACEKAGIERWTPNQLRHTAATRVRKKYNVEVARSILGHSNLSTTEIYAEEDRSKAIKAMLEIG